MSACAADSLRVGEPLIGTAPVAQCWVVIEQPGPWGRQALHDSHLDPALGALLSGAADGTGTRILLARHPGRPERTGNQEHNIWIAHGSPGTSRLRHGQMTDLSALAGWDFAAMAQGSLPEFGDVTRTPVLFICTHSGRDACCAIFGRHLITDLLGRIPEAQHADVWECSHIGGHRFAPTALSLPSGNVYGRLTTDTALQIFDNERERVVASAHYRGRSAFPAPMQVAEAAVRDLGVIDRDVLDVLWVRGDRVVPVAPGVELENIASMTAEVRHVDGRAWRVQVRQEPLSGPRAESCGKEPVEGFRWLVLSVEPAASWV